MTTEYSGLRTLPSAAGVPLENGSGSLACIKQRQRKSTSNGVGQLRSVKANRLVVGGGLRTSESTGSPFKFGIFIKKNKNIFQQSKKMFERADPGDPEFASGRRNGVQIVLR